ncbi:MAG: hypothetical protein QM295_05085 [Bacillota bacterium]|nr:hypothetical protein [Bacillota bacterium]
MIYGIIDVREWQTSIDLETGKKHEINSELANIAKNIISKNYYPGDLDPKSVEWIKNVALEVNSIYKPNFMFINFAQPHFMSCFKQVSADEWHRVIDNIFDNIEMFLDKSGFIPVIVGLGNTIPLIDYIDLSSLDGIAFCSGMPAGYAGLFDATLDDIKYLEHIPEIKRIVSKQEFIEQFGGNPDFIRRFPDYILEAEKGYAFKAYGTITRPIYQTPAKNETIPVYTPFHSADLNCITQIKGLIEKNLANKNKIALIIIEGIGAKEFKFPCVMCSNKTNWYTYDDTHSQYLAITAGKHFQYNGYPPGYKYFLEDGKGKKYPFSGPFTELPQDIIGNRLNIKSAAIGNRSVLTHLASGADISIECLARSLYNHGTMAIISQEA